MGRMAGHFHKFVRAALWDAATGEKLRKDPGERFSADSSRVMFAVSGAVRIYECATFKQVGAFKTDVAALSHCVSARRVPHLYWIPASE